MSFSDWIIANGEDLQFLVFFGLLPLLLGLERLIPRRPGPMHRKQRWPANFSLTGASILSLGIMPVSLVGSAAFAHAHGWGLLNWVALPVPAVIAVSLLIRGFISFFTHYLMHKIPLLWRIHRVHHLDTEMDVTTTVRVHPLEFFVGALPGIPFVIAFGLERWVLVFYETLDVVITLWTHSNVRLPPLINGLFRYLVVTPDVHRIHHSAWQPETDSNFGAVFPIWDLVFGTYRAEPRDGHERMRIGLNEVRGPSAHRFVWLLGSVRNQELTDDGAKRPKASTQPVSR